MSSTTTALHPILLVSNANLMSFASQRNGTILLLPSVPLTLALIITFLSCAFLRSRKPLLHRIPRWVNGSLFGGLLISQSHNNSPLTLHFNFCAVYVVRACVVEADHANQCNSHQKNCKYDVHHD
eukprot:TRINITY_DN1304_c0_g1_i1.p2 TRINITY_DN1304_c0_g1~~TRINITY_DN1304_c0_g1_i1.p2  ORF type:complete len:125 (-),score=13.43 TRINITY_DN1304_c0_g1_i1:535-909(-)